MKQILLVLVIFFSVANAVAQPGFSENYPDSVNKKRLRTVVGTKVASYAAGVTFLGFIWYKDSERVPFHFYNDNKGYLQMDKAGHAFSAYRESYAAYHALRWAGVDKKKALIFGGPMGLLLQTPIEVFDGLYEGWGFSWGDMGANAFGSLMFVVQEAIWEDQIVLMKFSYAPSGYPKYHTALGENQLESFFLDYNGHTYWFSGNLTKLTGIQKIPKWLNIAVGYSSNGVIKEFENPKFYRGEAFPHLERYRQWLFSLDIDFSKVPTRKKWVKKVFRAINLLKVPFPALEINRIDGVKMRGLYF